MSWDPAEERWEEFASRLRATFNLDDYELAIVRHKLDKLATLTQELQARHEQHAREFQDDTARVQCSKT